MKSTKFIVFIMLLSFISLSWALYVEGTIDVCPQYYMADARTPFIAHFSASSSSLTLSAASSSLRMSIPGTVTLSNYYTWSTVGAPGWRNDVAGYATRQAIPISNTTAAGWLVDMSTTTGASAFGTSSVAVRFRAPNNGSNNLDVAPIGGATIALYIPITGLDSTTNGGWIEGTYRNGSGVLQANVIVLAKDSSGNILGSYITENNGVAEQPVSYDSTSTGYYKLAVPVGQVVSLEFRDLNNNTLRTKTGPWTITAGLTTSANLKPPVTTIISPISASYFQANGLAPSYWNAVTDPDNDPVTYQFGIDFYGGTTSLINGGAAWVTDTTAYMSFPFGPGAYFWKIRAFDGYDFATAWSEPAYMEITDTTMQVVVNGPSPYAFSLCDGAERLPVNFWVYAVNGVDTVTMSIFNQKHPFAHDSANHFGNTYFISRWWRITNTSGIGSADILFQYTADDLADANLGPLPETGLEFAKYSGGNWGWLPYTSIFTTSHQIRINGVSSFSDWTLSGPGGVPVELSQFEAVLRKQ